MLAIYLYIVHEWLIVLVNASKHTHLRWGDASLKINGWLWQVNRWRCTRVSHESLGWNQPNRHWADPLIHGRQPLPPPPPPPLPPCCPNGRRTRLLIMHLDLSSLHLVLPHCQRLGCSKPEGEACFWGPGQTPVDITGIFRYWKSTRSAVHAHVCIYIYW